MLYTVFIEPRAGGDAPGILSVCFASVFAGVWIFILGDCGLFFQVSRTWYFLNGVIPTNCEYEVIDNIQ